MGSPAYPRPDCNTCKAVAGLCPDPIHDNPLETVEYMTLLMKTQEDKLRALLVRWRGWLPSRGYADDLEAILDGRA